MEIFLVSFVLGKLKSADLDMASITLASTVALYSSAVSSVSQPWIQLGQSVSEKQIALNDDASGPDEKSKKQCSLRVTGFVRELDQVFDSEHSILPIKQLFKKYFPLVGCDFDQVLDICRKSRYFDSFTKQQDILIISFDNQPYHPFSKLYVQFDLDRRSGKSSEPFVVIR